MTDDLQTLLRPLRELEPTIEELDRARAAAREHVLRAPVGRRRRLSRIGAGRPRLALAGAAAIAIALAVTFLPVGDERSLRSALRAAAAAAAAVESPVPPLTGYRHVVERVHVQLPGSAPREYVREVWIDAQWQGVERTDGVDGGPVEAAALANKSGPFGKAPLAELPVDPGALLKDLNAAYDDGRYAAPDAAAWTEQPEWVWEPEGRRLQMALGTAWLIAESNATPALRAAGFGVLERLGGARDLGTVEDAEGRAGHGLEMTWDGRPARGGRSSTVLRLIFDSATGEMLSVRVSGGVGDQQDSEEHTYLSADQVRELPDSVRDAA